MNREIASLVALREGIQPQVQTAGVVTGATIDTRGFDSVTAALVVGAIVAAGIVTYKMQDGDAANMSDAADVAAADLTTPNFTALLQNTQQWVGYRGPKRYVRLIATYASGTSVAHAATFIMSSAQTQPAA